MAGGAFPVDIRVRISIALCHKPRTPGENPDLHVQVNRLELLCLMMPLRLITTYPMAENCRRYFYKTCELVPADSSSSAWGRPNLPRRLWRRSRACVALENLAASR